MKAKRQILLLLSISLLIGLYGCRKPVNVIQLGDWINLLADKAGIGSSESERPYFLNVSKDSPYYDAVQSCTDWGILLENQDFDPKENLTRGWTAATLTRLMDLDRTEIDSSIKDIPKEPFAKEVSAIVKNGLMQCDRHGRFHPDEVMDKMEAEQLLNQAVHFINNPVIEERNNIAWRDGGKLLSKEPVAFDIDNKTASFDHTVEPHAGDLFVKDDVLYRIDTVEEDKIAFHQTDFFDEIESIDIAGSEELDFDNAEIEVGEQIQDTIPMSSAAGSFVSGKQDIVEINGYKVELYWSAGNFTAKATKELPHGSKVLASASLHNVRTDYQWRGLGKDGNTFFKITCRADESLGVQRDYEKSWFADPNELKDVKDAGDLVNKLKKVFKENKDEEKQTIEICKIKVPVAGNPLVSVKISLNLNVTASGKAEIAFTQTGEFGVETRNGKPRRIVELNNHAQGSLQAEAALTAEFLCGFSVPTVTLADVGIEAGIKGKAGTTVHLYDKEGRKKSEDVKIDPDFAMQAAEKSNNVLICADLQAYKVLTLNLCSSNSMLGKLGMSKSFDIINEDNGSLIPEISGHYENGQIVKKCTRKNRIKLADISGVQSGKRIELKPYSLVVHKNEPREITVKALPEGYSPLDLTYVSLDSEIAEVDQDGIVYGLNSGSTVIKVNTKDGRYTASCSILVPEK